MRVCDKCQSRAPRRRWDGVVVKKKKIKQIELLDVADLDLTKRWPYADNSVKEIKCVHKLEFIPGKQRVAFMEEAWRVLEVGGTMTVVVCYYSSTRAIQDPMLQWPPMCEQSFLYFNKGWREANQLPPIKCDFEFPSTYGYSGGTEISTKNQETQTYWVAHYLNSVADLHMTLTKRAA
jgi:hypothetical protein